MDRPGVRQVPEGSGEQGKMEEIGCEIIGGAPTTLAVKGKMRDDGESDSNYDSTKEKITHKIVRLQVITAGGFCV